VIVVIGQPVLRDTAEGDLAGGVAVGSAARIAITAAGAGHSVQLVAKIGEDPEGDAVMLALARGRVGHVTVSRDAGIATPHVSQAVDEGRDTGALEAADSAELAPEGPRDAASTLDAADIDLALRYLTDFTVVVLAVRADEATVRVVEEATRWAGSRLIVVVPAGGFVPDGLPHDSIVFEAPDSDPDGVFAAFVGSFAAALDDGSEPEVAFRSSVEGLGWEPAPDS
jgi:sugar/nucleoside kinase (ribokinase family)